jgi:hypothetical protein
VVWEKEREKRQKQRFSPLHFTREIKQNSVK